MQRNDVLSDRTGDVRERAGNGADQAHVVGLVERGPFLQPVCSCGWTGNGRRSRPAARDEADRHAGLASA